MKTLKEQMEAIREAAKQLDKEIAVSNYDDKLKAELEGQLYALLAAIETLRKLEDTKNFLNGLL